MFRIGDRVTAVCAYGTHDGVIKVGDVGTIAKSDDTIYGIIWDRNVGGHDINGACLYGHGWWMLEDEISLIEEEDIDLEPPHDIALLFA